MIQRIMWRIAQRRMAAEAEPPRNGDAVLGLALVGVGLLGWHRLNRYVDAIGRKAEEVLYDRAFQADLDTLAEASTRAAYPAREDVDPLHAGEEPGN